MIGPNEFIPEKSTGFKTDPHPPDLVLELCNQAFLRQHAKLEAIGMCYFTLLATLVLQMEKKFLLVENVTES